MPTLPVHGSSPIKERGPKSAKSSTSTDSEGNGEGRGLSVAKSEHAAHVRRSLSRADELEHAITDGIEGDLRRDLEKKAIRMKMDVIDWMNVRTFG